MAILTTISPINREREKKIQQEIYQYIDEGCSMIFNSGAGAGKTYALIESLKYIITNYGEQLTRNNQKIICITYTNVATQEVKERLGNTDLVLVSTIHERIWQLIKNYQKQLVQIHKEKLEEEVIFLEQSLEQYESYNKLKKEQKVHLKNIMSKKVNRDLFYDNLHLGAHDFKSLFEYILKDCDNILRNVDKFKKIIKTIYRIDNYLKCIENIKAEKPKYREVEYTSLYNRDRLHKMQISHHTLLEYGKKESIKYFV